MLLIDPANDGCIIDANKAVLSFYGYSHEEICKLHTWEINTLGRNVVPVMNEIHSWEGGHKPLNFVHRMADGSERDVQTYAGPVIIDSRRLMLSIIHDITAQKETEHFNRLILEHSQAGIIVVDKEGKINFSNPRAIKILGFNHESELINKNIRDISNNSNKNPSVFKLHNQVISSNIEVNDYETWFMQGEKNEVPVLLSVTGIELHGIVTGTVISFIDISRRKVLEAELEHAAQTDALTGLLNRRQFETLLEKEHAKAKRHNQTYSTILLDIDFFKKVNDTFGHDMGDQALCGVSNLLSTRVRETDYVCRWGGEEFIVLMQSTTQEEAVILAEDLRQSASELNIPSIKQITISLGVSQYQHGDSYEKVLKRADNALYVAKNNGRNRVEVAKDS